MSSLHGKRCLVLGAGGFLGAELCKQLCDAGAIVRGFGRSVRLAGSLDERVAWITGALADRPALAAALAGQELVFHLVSETVPATSNRDPAADFVAATTGLLALLDTCRDLGTRKIVFASSGGTIYGPQPTVPIPEDAPTNPISAYGVTKLMAEKYLHLYRYQWGLDFQTLRIANPYGPWQSPFVRQGVVANMIYRGLTGMDVEMWGSGAVVRDFVHVADVARAFVAAAEYSGKVCTMNVGSGEGRSIAEVFGAIADVPGMPPLRKVLRDAQAADVPANVLDISLIERETGWRPLTSWESGLAETAAWMRQHLLSR